MAETMNTEDQASDNQSTNPVDDAEQHTGQGSNGGDEGNKQSGAEREHADSLEELPEWARKQITELRRESASYRTERNDLRERLEQAKDNPEDNKKLIEQLQSELRETSLKATRLDIARKHNLPESADVLLHGEDADSLSEQAKLLSQLFGASAQSASAPTPSAPHTTPSNPRNPERLSDPNPADLLAQARSRRTY